MYFTGGKQEKLATPYGCYFSILFELEYFDGVRFTVIDPMYNLFLGTAKRTLDRKRPPYKR